MERMDNCIWSSFPYPSHCWALPVQAKPLFKCFQCNASSTCSSSCLVPSASGSRPLITTRCLCLGHGPYFPDPVKNLEGLLDTAGVPVLARREEDGYYYLGTVIKQIEGKERTFLVKFAKPMAGDEEDTTHVQKTASGDILEYVNGMRHSILPGDKVLAPWEPERKRYGPGTVIRGIETRDPLRVKEEEKIMVSFWNGKKAKIPLGVALWIPPMQWRKIVDMIHMPLTSRKQFEGRLHRPNYYICPCGPLAAPIYTCTNLGGLHMPRSFFAYTGPRVFHHTCSLFAQPQYCCCCCCFKPSEWCQQPFLGELPLEGVKDEMVTSKANTQFLALEGPPGESAPAPCSSPSCSPESPNSGETCLTKTAMVNHAVNTDVSLFDKPKQQEVKRPEWKYWKRSHPRSSYKCQGINFP